MKSGSLRVWWIPQIPMKPFYVLVPDLRTAELMLTTLAEYDLFQFENQVRPDYSNVGGLQVFDEIPNEWLDFSTEDGEDFDDLDDDKIRELDTRLGRGDKVWSS